MKKENDQNKEIRDSLINLNNYVSKLFEGNTPNEYQRDYALNYFYVVTFSGKAQIIAEKTYSFIPDEDLRKKYVNIYATKIILYSSIIVCDLYIKLNHDYILDKLTKENEKLFSMIIKAMEKNDVTMLLSDIKNIKAFVDASINFSEASAYEKIALLGALDEEDIKALSKFNPFFKEEFDHYNIALDEEFFIRQITKWKNGKKDLNVALEKTAEFIIDMSYANPDKIDNIFKSLLNYTDEETLVNLISTENIEEISKILNEFYNEKKEKELKK